MILLATLWLCWCSLHSLLITDAATRLVQQKGGFLQGAYRLLYVLFAFLSLAPVLRYQLSLEQHLIFSWHGPWRIVQAVLLLYSAIMFYGGKQVYDTSFFLGIRQWQDYRKNTKATELPFTSKGILGHVRHPWYSGSFTLLWGMGSLTDVTLLVRIILSLYLIVGTLLEERKLNRLLGTPYRQYCKEVPMLIPKLTKFHGKP